MPRTRRKKKQSLWPPQELRKEEIRGIFVIGTVALIVAFRYVFSAVAFKIYLLGGIIKATDLIDSLIFCWVFYIVLMAIALADDFFVRVKRVRLSVIPEFCKTLAPTYFVIGVIFNLVVISLIFWPLTIYLVGFIFYFRHKRRGKKGKH